MIIWIRNRRGWILGLFIALIIVFAGGFVIGGVGSGNNYSLGDILDQNGNGASTTAQSADITALRAKVKANPKDAASWSLLADAYLASSTDGKEAAKALTTYLDLKPGDLSAMQRLATSYLSAYQYETQLGQAYTSQAGSLPGLTDSTFDSGTLSSLTTDALQSAQAAQSQAKQTELLTKARPYQTRAAGYIKKAVETYGKVVAAPRFAQSDNPASTLFQYGRVAEAARDTKTAIKAYQKFLAIAPDDPSAAAVKARLKTLQPAVSATTTTTTATQ